jgi:thiamine-monophosphate kinase
MPDSPWTENDVISYIRSACLHVPEALGLLDDCAILPKCSDEFWLISQDSCVEGVHFQAQYYSPKEIGHKVFHSTISDIAAMGGNPEFISLGLSLPKGPKKSYVEALLQGFIDSANACNVKIIGGDTTRSPAPIFLSATAFGSVKANHLKKRSTAKPGNLLALTGNFGYASLGLRMLDKPHLAQKYPPLIAAQKTPLAMLENGRLLGKCAAITAMIDVSDGILKDTENLCKASGLQVHLDCQKIPLPNVVINGAHDLELSALKTVLEGGEDYGLMVAIDNLADRNILNEVISAAGLVVIGYFSHGTPSVLLENMPPTLAQNPPTIFEHGG